MSATLPPDFTLLQVVPRLNGGGVERATLDMVVAVVRAGGRALVASYGGPMEAELVALGGQLVRLPVHARDPLSILANAGKLARVIRDEGVSLVHVRSRAPAFSAIRAARRAGVPVVATYHGIYSDRSSWKRWYNGVMTRGDLVIANSGFTRDHILGRHAVEPDRIVVVPEGIDTARFDPMAVSPGRIDALRAAWSLAPDDRRHVILCAARLTPWKGQLTAIEAFAARPRRENAVMILAGLGVSAAYADALRLRAEALGVGRTVKVVGQADDMPAALLVADLVLAPSREAESFGRTVVEAAAMGRPVVASDLGAHRETLRDGETGWLAPPRDAAAWTRAIDKALAASVTDRETMGRAARHRATALYSLETMISETFAIYRRLAATAK